jgi:serine/threonine protein kinase/uncharacterized protein YjiS (DUF1127 family)
MQGTNRIDVGEPTDADLATETSLDSAGDPDGARAEFERLRHKLGFSGGPLIDGRYRIERLLGRGAMGEVYLAQDQRLGRLIALKLVRASSRATAMRLQVRLEREALALARVTHPNVVHIYDVGTHAGQTFLTMQFVSGTTLRGWQRDENRTRSELIDAYLQAGRGLAAAHSGNVLHRDFKPDNVMVGDDGIVRVLDFGLAAALQPESSLDASASATGLTASSGTKLSASQSGSEIETLPGNASERMTQVGSLVGTLAYMSSEQLEGREADARSDQFAFCVAMWEGLTGKRPFAGTGIFELVLSIERGPKSPTGLPRWLRPILVRGLDNDPSRRWPSMVELLHAIERARARGRKLALGVGLPATILAAVLVDRQLQPTPPPPADTCAAFVAQIDERWSDTQRAAITAHSGIDAEATAYAISTLDQLAGDWKVAAAASCEGESTESAYDPERDCLVRWLDGFSRTIELLSEHADDKTLARAPDLLAQLRPPNANYCALGPTKPCDPEVWRLTERARGLATLGDLTAARELADAGLARAEALDELQYSGERALAHEAKAEVAMAEGDTQVAIEHFQLAQHHALATDFPYVLLSTWTWWAKLLVAESSARAADADLALVRIQQAEPLLFSLQLPELDTRRAELLEAHGMSERARDNHNAAMVLHRQAHALFVEAGLPTRASKSLLNIGAVHHDVGFHDDARQSYTEALALLDAAGLPASYRNRIKIRRNLGLLAYAASDVEAIAEGIPHLEFVIAHGNENERFEAHELMLALVLALDDAELARHWTERALAALEQRPHASVEERFRMQRVAGLALAYAGDPRGEELLRAAERSSESLSPLMQFNLQSSWVDWLERAGRCSEADDRRDRLAERLANADADVASRHTQWRSAGPTGSCAAKTSTTPQ